jgi:hypothetical protein
VVGILKSLGHEVYDFKNPPHGRGGFSWGSIDHAWEGWTTEEYRKALDHTIAVKGFDSDFSAMKWADCCVMVLPCGRSANSEAGWFSGANKLVYVFSPDKEEPELMYKMYNGIIANYAELVSTFNSIK